MHLDHVIEQFVLLFIFFIQIEHYFYIDNMNIINYILILLKNISNTSINILILNIYRLFSMPLSMAIHMHPSHYCYSLFLTVCAPVAQAVLPDRHYAISSFD